MFFVRAAATAAMTFLQIRSQTAALEKRDHVTWVGGEVLHLSDMKERAYCQL